MKRKSSRSSSSNFDRDIRDRDVREPDGFVSPEGGRRKGKAASIFNAVSLMILAGVFVLGVGVGIGFSSTANFTPANVASSVAIDSKAPNAEVCIQNGASAITMDARLYLTLNPFNVFITQPTVQPGCVLRSANWAILEQRKLVSQDQVRECRQRMNTFGYTGSLENNPEISCIYQNEAAKNLFLNQPGAGTPPPDTQRF